MAQTVVEAIRILNDGVMALTDIATRINRRLVLVEDRLFQIEIALAVRNKQPDGE